jgi:hypothetical protein
MKNSRKPRPKAKAKSKAKPGKKVSQLKKNWREIRTAFAPGKPEKRLKEAAKIYASFKGI